MFPITCGVYLVNGNICDIIENIHCKFVDSGDLPELLIGKKEGQQLILQDFHPCIR